MTSVAAVLVALPMSVERAAGGTVGADAVPPIAGSGVTAAGVPPTDLGVMLWLSVAVVAAVVACLVLHHSRTHVAPAADASTSLFPFTSGMLVGGPPGASAAGESSTRIGG